MHKTESLSKISDEKLVELTLKDQKHYAELISKYRYKLLRYIQKITNVSDEDAEDLLQETFIKAYYNLNSFDPDLKFSSWIYRIAHNQVISNYRKLKARPQGHAIQIDEKMIRTLAANLDTKRDADLHYLAENIGRVFSAMDIKYREVLILKFLEEKEYKEISDILKKPMGTVATLINRAKKQFRKQAEKLNLDLF